MKITTFCLKFKLQIAEKNDPFFKYFNVLGEAYPLIVKIDAPTSNTYDKGYIILNDENPLTYILYNLLFFLRIYYPSILFSSNFDVSRKKFSTHQKKRKKKDLEAIWPSQYHIPSSLERMQLHIEKVNNNIRRKAANFHTDSSAQLTTTTKKYEKFLYYFPFARRK